MSPKRLTWLVLICACGGTTAFHGGSSTIVGTLPPLPPAPTVAAPAPRVEIRNNQITISEKIQFDVDKATIKSESNSLLDEIVAVFKNNPQLEKVSIDGFASSEGNAEFNKRLSDDRAKSVMAYLVDHGIDKDRLLAKGWGIEKPIADNSTDVGRELNRRVEFNILQQKVTNRTVQIDPVTGKEKVVETNTKDVMKTDDSAAAAGGSR
jgi:outer membrane protein OmpA-like peptidoglycan-associated protein